MARTPGTTLDPGTHTPVAEPPATPIEPSESLLDAPPVHPIADFAVRARTRLDHLTSPTSRPVWAMTTTELRQTLHDLAIVTNQLDALRLTVLAEADRNGHVADPGDRTAADHHARTTHQRRAVARADLRLAHTLDTQLPVLAAAMATGAVSLDQARSITRSLDLLPTDGQFAVDATQRAHAEAHLVDLAHHHDAHALDLLGRRIYAVICPEKVDDHEGRVLRAQEARAARKVTLETWTDHQGITHGHFRIPQLHGAMLKKALDAIMSPARAAGAPAEPTPESTSDRRPLPVRRGEALCELLERMTARDLPTTAGGDATIVVTMHLDDLTETLSKPGSRPSTPATTSPPPKPDASPATTSSSPPSSTEPRSPSTSAGRNASTPRPNALR